MSDNKHSDQECYIHVTWFLAHTEWDKRMQIINRCPCELSTYVRERDVNLRREGNGDTAFGR